jgi:hypothetical protein
LVVIPGGRRVFGQLGPDQPATDTNGGHFSRVTTGLDLGLAFGGRLVKTGGNLIFGSF